MSRRRFEDDITGSANASGIATLTWRGMTGQWASLLMIAQSTGSPSWVVNLNGAPVAVGRGASSPMALPILEPGDIVTVKVTGATPGAAIKCHLVGYASNAGIADLPLSPLMPSTIALDTAGQLATVIDRLDTSAVASKTYTMPPGVVSVGVAIDQNNSDATHSVFPQSIKILGLPSTDNYLNVTPSGIPGSVFVHNIWWAVVDPNDTTFTVSIPGFQPNGVFLDVLAAPLLMNGQSGDGKGGLLVSQAQATPAPWQAALASKALNNAPALNTDFTIVAAVAGKTIYLHDVCIGSNSSSFFELQLWDGPSAGGNLIADLATSEAIAAAGGTIPIHWDGKGRPNTSGNALVGKLINASAGATIFGAVGYSQV